MVSFLFCQVKLYSQNKKTEILVFIVKDSLEIPEGRGAIKIDSAIFKSNSLKKIIRVH
jgi:hypothetical protein